MITVELDNFSLRQICQSGQCFRMRETEENTYELIAGDQYLKLTQEGTIVTFHCSDVEFLCYWVPYFDIDADYAGYIEKINPRDHYLSAAAECGSGIRILRQDLWEIIITFLISQQNNISRIRGCVERLCEAYGEKKISGEKEYYAFPTPEQLAVSLEKLYRMRYYRRARQELMKLSGVGEKVADCICLFALHHMDAFPIDTHIRQVLDIHYKRGFPNRRYHGFRGIMQQYIFYYELTGAADIHRTK